MLVLADNIPQGITEKRECFCNSVTVVLLFSVSESFIFHKTLVFSKNVILTEGYWFCLIECS